MADAKMLNLEAQMARLVRIPQSVQSASGGQLKTEATDLAAAIKRAAPKKSGALEGSIGAEPGASPLTYTVFAGGRATTKKIRSRKVSAGRGKTQGVSDADFAKALESGGNAGEFDYSRADEFGHLTHDGKHVPAHPFFFVTWRAQKKGIRQRLRAVAKAAIAKEFPE